jgi:hypothetical protein
VLVLVQHPGVKGRGMRIIGHRIPGTENQIIQCCQGDELPNQRRALLGPLAQPNGTHLGDRSDGASGSAADVLHPGDERGGNCAQPHT